MFLNFFLSVQIRGAFARFRLQLSFFHFQGHAHAIADVVCLVVAILEVILVLVIGVSAVNVIPALIFLVAAVNVILVADDRVRFPKAPTLTPIAALAVFPFFS